MSTEDVTGATTPMRRKARIACSAGAPPASRRLNSTDAAMWWRSGGVGVCALPPPPASRCAAATETPMPSATMPPIASMAMTTRSSTVLHDGCQQSVDALDLRLEGALAERGNRATDVDLFVDRHPAPAAAVCLGHLDAGGLRQPPGAHGDDVDGLVGTEAVAGLERRPIVLDDGIEAEQRLEIAHLPRPHDLRPVRDRHAVRLAAARVVVVRREEIEAVRLEPEVRVGQTAFADQYDLFPAVERGDDGSPLLERGVIRQLFHGLFIGRNVTELTGPSQMVTAVTTAFSAATSPASSRQNHSAIFSAEGLIRSNGVTSLMQP